jgi:hypothetical protein
MLIMSDEAIALRRLLGHHMSTGALAHMGLLDLSVRLGNVPGLGNLGVLTAYDLTAVGSSRKGENLTPAMLHHERRKDARST